MRATDGRFRGIRWNRAATLLASVIGLLAPILLLMPSSASAGSSLPLTDKCWGLDVLVDPGCTGCTHYATLEVDDDPDCEDGCTVVWAYGMVCPAWESGGGGVTREPCDSADFIDIDCRGGGVGIAYQWSCSACMAYDPWEQ